ncbi:MAG: FecR domain-containing protein, partial [Treponema sp.]|nr:FecR domain-containing protein [Treponema sp.]
MKSSRLSFRDVLIILLCAAGFSLCILLFLRDINAAYLRLNEQHVGTISFRYNTAQRRFIDRVIWDRLRNNSPVYHGDIIRTANLSEATITFENGNSVEVLSNTLIQIYSDNFGSRVDFSGGNISVNASGAGMVISSGDKNLTVDAGAVVQAVSHQNGVLNLTVSEGTAFLDNAAIEAGFGLLFDAEGRTMAIPQAVAVSPRPGTRFLSPPEGLVIDFIWNSINYTPEVMTRLEVAYDRSFNRIFFAQETSARSLGVTLPEGSWFWRLYPVSPDTTASVDAWAEIPYARIAVIYNLVPELISPRHNETFSFRSRPPPLRFQWTSSPQASSYVLEAANNPSLQNPALSLHVHSDTGDMLSVLSSALEAGTWYWRVTPVYSRDFAGSPASSVTQSFTIERGAPLTAPVLTSPAENAVINTGTGGRDIIFSWRRETEAVSYTISIASNSSMNSPVIERTLTDTLYRHGADETALAPGVWYWTVRQTGHDGEISAASVPRMVSFVQENIVQRQIFPADNYTVAENLLPDMRFTWRTNLNNTRFQLSPDGDFTRIL